MSQQAPDLERFWTYVTDQTKSKISMPALWRAMEAAKPLTVHGDELILGYDPAQMHQSGLVLDHRHRNVIEQIIEGVARRRLKLRIIPGQTLEDWELARQT